MEELVLPGDDLWRDCIMPCLCGVPAYFDGEQEALSTAGKKVKSTGFIRDFVVYSFKECCKYEGLNKNM